MANMQKPCTVILAGMVVFFTTVGYAHAADALSGAVVDKTLDSCLNDPQQASTGGQDDCFDAATKQWDQLLNRRYQALKAALPAAAQPALVDAQRAWLRSRDADLELIASVYETVTGTMYAPMNANDIMAVTRSRAQTLAAYLTDLSGRPFDMPGALSPLAQNDFTKQLALPKRGSTYERAHCRNLKDAKAAGACATHALPLYEADLRDMERQMAQSLPVPTRPVLTASQRSWQAFRQAEAKLIGQLRRPDDDPDAGTMQALHTRQLVAERLQTIENETAMINAN
jgi:uncharacterized protein YecT (DUF1311 family)